MYLYMHLSVNKSSGKKCRWQQTPSQRVQMSVTRMVWTHLYQSLSHFRSWHNVFNNTWHDVSCEYTHLYKKSYCVLGKFCNQCHAFSTISIYYKLSWSTFFLFSSPPRTFSQFVLLQIVYVSRFRLGLGSEASKKRPVWQVSR